MGGTKDFKQHLFLGVFVSLFVGVCWKERGGKALLSAPDLYFEFFFNLGCSQQNHSHYQTWRKKERVRLHYNTNSDSLLAMLQLDLGSNYVTVEEYVRQLKIKINGLVF